MGLEDGDFISDLDLSNPITATDPVTEGSNHLRLIKKVLLQTFPNYDEAVTLTPAQLNDAALKSSNEIVTGSWGFTSLITANSGLIMDNDVSLRGKNSVGTARTLAVVEFNNVGLGDRNVTQTVVRANTSISLELADNKVVEVVPGAAGSLLAADAAGDLSPVAKTGTDETIEGAWKFLGGIELDNNISLTGLNSGGSARNIGVVEGNAVVLGDASAGTSIVRANGIISFELNGSEYAQIVPRNIGAILVADRTNTLKKVGFRNPGRINLPDGGVFTQDMEGQIADYAGLGDAVTVDQLEVFTAIALNHRGSGQLVLQEGAGVTINWRDGSGGMQTGNRTIEINSMVSLWWRSATQVDIVGNGIS